jgi:HSP20 family protein
MAFIRFYNPLPAYRDENANETYENMVRRFSGNTDCGCEPGSTLASNISESEKEFIIEVALPGVDKNDIHLSHEKGILTIRVTDNNPSGESMDSYTRREFGYSGASRSFRTGEKIDAENIRASHENGILRVYLPKKSEYISRPAQNITVE